MPMSSTDSEPTSPSGGQVRPPVVTAARWVFIIAAVLMVLAGLILASAHYTGHEDSDFIHAWERNMRIVGIANVLLAIAVMCMVQPSARSYFGVRSLWQ